MPAALIARGSKSVWIGALLGLMPVGLDPSELVVNGPEGATLRVPVRRDTWVSTVGEEADANLGGAPRLKLKSIQEMTLLDVDPKPLRGRVIARATLHLRRVAEPKLLRLTVSTVATPWGEGTSPGYEPQAGGASFRRAQHPDGPWAGPGSADLTEAVLSRGGTLWRMADATAPDAQGWQAVPVDPLVLAARVADLASGFLVFDDTGTEWSHRGDEFKLSPFPNRFVASREAGRASAPYFTVELGPKDDQPPAAVSALRAEPADDLPPGEAVVTWTTPADAGPAGTLGFLVTLDGQPAPRHLIPLAAAVGAPVRMALYGLDQRPGATLKIEVRAVDAAGNVGPPTRGTVTLSNRQPKPLPGQAPKLPKAADALFPKLGPADVAILDELDKVHPTTGKLIPEQPEGYLRANHLWDAARRTIRLHAARNEFTAFQILIRGDRPAVKPGLQFEGPAAARLKTEFGRYRAVGTKGGPLPDPIVPLGSPPDDRVPGRTSTSLHAELYVPHDAPAGEHRGTLTLVDGGQTLSLPVVLTVWDFTLPDALSFLPEMNCYGLPENERDYYRLAHRHRTVLNSVPYAHSGRVSDGCAPRWDGQRLDWTAWDKRFGPLLDGSAFSDLPRKGVPLECLYLPLFENWPTPMAGHYNESYWADEAFPARYRANFVEVSRQFAEHFHAKKYDQTLFHFYLNGKNNFKEPGWSKGTCPWWLDEPAHWQDFWALRYFGAAFHEGIHQAKGPAKLLFRADISRPQWRRDGLDGLLDYHVVGSAFRTYRRRVLDDKQRFGEIVVEYGSTGPIEGSNLQPLGWCLEAWALGADGVLPWQTVGTDASWKQADELALFYPGRKPKEGPIPSVRLKAYRRGQQDVEYLTLLAKLEQEPRWALGEQVRQALGLAGQRQGTGFTGGEDAGRIDYGQLRPQDVWALRIRIGEALSQARPKPERQLVEFRTPRRDPGALPERMVSGTGPARGAATSTAAPKGPLRTTTVQGPRTVRDALIDSEKPEQALGTQPRDNAIRRGDQPVSALLLQFDLGQADPAKLETAELSVFVWDPSTQGRTRLEARPLTTAWDEASVSWSGPTAAKRWTQGAFAVEADTAAGSPASRTIVEPEGDTDLADPPVEVRLDVTDLVRDWLAGRRPNHGLALVPVPDRSVDEGQYTRFQVYATESGRAPVQPKLTIRSRP